MFEGKLQYSGPGTEGEFKDWGSSEFSPFKDKSDFARTSLKNLDTDSLTEGEARQIGIIQDPKKDKAAAERRRQAEDELRRRGHRVITPEEVEKKKKEGEGERDKGEKEQKGRDAVAAAAQNQADAMNALPFGPLNENLNNLSSALAGGDEGGGLISQFDLLTTATKNLKDIMENINRNNPDGPLPPRPRS